MAGSNRMSRSRSRSPSPERSNSQDSSRRSRSSSSSSCSSNSSSSSSNSSKSRSGSQSNRSRSLSKSPDKQDEKRNRSVSKSPERVETTPAAESKEENKTVSEDIPVEKKADNECEQQKMEEPEETLEEKPEEVEKIQEQKKKCDVDEVEERKESSQHEEAEPVDAEQTEDNSQKSQESSAKPVMKITMRKISINSAKESHKNKENIDVSSDGDKPTRKRKWGSSTTKAVKKTSLSISTDSLKNLIPDVAPITAVVIGDSLPDIQEASTSEAEEAKEMTAIKDLKIRRTVTQVVNEEPMIVDQPETEQTKSEVPEQMTQVKPLLATTTTKPAEEPLERPRSPSPARNPVSKIIHIRNLVRPFTLNQLKELLARTGTLLERGFWIDKIKSKCYATYESVEQAVATRQALHGVQWPPSNRKNLIVDYADEDEFNFHVNLTETTELHKSDLRKELPLRDSTRRVRENVTAIPNTHLSKSKERPPLPPPIREWDRDKIGERSPGEKVRARHHRSKSPVSPSRDRKRDRSKEHKEKREKRDRKKEEETPSKLLDDLFKKTKSTPCIYWLPLTVEQIKIRDEENKKREEERKKKQIEREKRRQELEKEKGKDSTSDAKKTRNGDEKSNKRRSASPSRSRNRKR